MLLKRALPLLGIMLIMTGCFRQAQDNFDTVGSQNSGEVNLSEEAPSEIPPTSNVILINPDASQTPDIDSLAAQASSTARVVMPTESDANEPVASNTPITIPTATQAVASSTPQVVPTATEPVFITPGFSEENAQPTVTPTTSIGQPTLQPTPTVFGAISVAGDCEYEIQSGDNLFRIALNNDVSLNDLLTTNGLTEASVIQPGQVLTIPGCNDTGTTALAAESDDAEPTAIVLDDCDYEIEAGDTLFSIAIENGITLAALLAENELQENAIIQPGQIVTIPNCEDGDTASSSPSQIIGESTQEAMAGETYHTVISTDTLRSIALQYGVTVNDIIQANTIPNPNALTPGQQLLIPDSDS